MKAGALTLPGLAAGLAGLVGGCATVAPPPILIEPGVKTALVRVQVDVIADFADADTLTRIMDLGWDHESGELRIITERGIRWIDVAAGSHRDVTFSRRMFRAAPMSTADGARVIGRSGSRDVPILRLDGGVDRELRGDAYAVPLAANVRGNSASELLLPTRGGVRVYSADGRLLGVVRSPWYASDRTFVQADADPELEIVFVRPMGHTIEAHVVNGDGSIVVDWKAKHRTWLSYLPELGSDLVWGVTATGFIAFDARGREVQAYPAEGAGYLRDVSGARIGRRIALVASGNGYRGRSVLAIYEQADRLVYYEVFPGRTYTVTGHPTEPILFVGAGERVLRYRITSER